MSIRAFLKQVGLVKLCRAARMLFVSRLKYCLKTAGKSSYISTGVSIRKGTCSIGKNSWIGKNCWLYIDDLRIGNYVMLASGVSIVGGDHRFDIVGTPTIMADRDVSKPVVIEDDVWIGHGATIMHGVCIGEGAIVAAGALVTDNIAPYSIVGGIPAKLIRMRFNPEQIDQHKQSLQKLRESAGNK